MEEVYALQYNTNINPLIVFVVIILSILILSLKPRFVPILFLIGAFYVTGGQYIYIGNVFLYILRILVFVVIIRLFFRNEWHLMGKLNTIDKLIILWSLLLILQGFFQEKNFDVIISRIGVVVDTLGIYYVVRIYLRTVDDLAYFTRVLILLMIPVAVLMLFEKITTINLFSVLGGVPAFSVIREGTVRAQGPFDHPIMAGTLAASQIPLFFGLSKYSKKKVICYSGIAAAIIIIISCGSSGPIMSFAFSLIGVMSWKLRNKMSSVKIAIIFSIIMMEIFMKSHFWYIISKIDIVGGSTGWHRSELITSALTYLNEWWLFGTNFTRHWMPSGVPWNPNHTDLTNTFITMGVKGGLPLLITFVLLFVLSFRAVGKFYHMNAEDDVNQDRLFFVWTIGAVFFCHVLTFFTINYFGQILAILYSNIAFSSIILSINNKTSKNETISQ
jgi:hypothetical protein